MFSALRLLASGNVESLPPPDMLSQWQPLIMIGIALLFFYFILLRPEQKKRKEAEAQRSALQKGDKVTAMGIIGTVVKITDHTVVLRMVDDSKIEFVKGAISEVISSEQGESKKPEATA